MLRTAMLALGASLTIGAIAPETASAQLTGRASSQGATTPRRTTTVHQDPRINDGRYDRNGCYDDDRDNDRGRYDRGDYDRDGRNDKYKNKDGRYENRGRNDRRDDDDCRNDSARGNGPPFCRNGQGHPVHGMAWCREKGWSNTSLRNVSWGDIILRRPRYDAQRDLSRSVLESILGRTGFGRFDQQRMRLGSSSPMFGQWVDTSYGSILNLYSGGLQIAQILDRDRDGRADVVLLNLGSR